MIFAFYSAWAASKLFLHVTLLEGGGCKKHRRDGGEFPRSVLLPLNKEPYEGNLFRSSESKWIQ